MGESTSVQDNFQKCLWEVGGQSKSGGKEGQSHASWKCGAGSKKSFQDFSWPPHRQFIVDESQTQASINSK